MKNKYYIELLECYHNHSLSKEELLALFDWINTMKGETEYDQYLSEQIEMSDYKKISIPMPNPRQMLIEIKKKTKSEKTPVFTLSYFKKYAAILLLALAGGAMWFIANKLANDHEEISFAVAKGNKATLLLSDGSEVWLNSESKITYSGSNKRQIYLDGEAYLQVVKDKQQQFVVNTAYVDIIVYGTSFNVTAYPGDSAVNVSLVEGSVGIQVLGQDSITTITPGQVARFNARNNKMELYDKQLADVALWRNNELVITNANITALCQKMEAWYGVQIILTKLPRKNHMFNITIHNERIDEVLELIQKVTPIVYHIKEKEVIIEIE